ncbi:putative ribonuclease H-like domain-containing protein [Tanacetum coccineum]
MVEMGLCSGDEDMLLEGEAEGCRTKRQYEREVVGQKKSKAGSSRSRQEEWIDYVEVFALGLCSQPPGFVDHFILQKVYKVVKALYGLHQAPRAWYATLSTFLEKHGYKRGTIDKTLFIRRNKKDIMLVQVYVDDIIFGSTNKSWCDEFEALMQSRFQMSSMGELTFFLAAITPMETKLPLTKDEEAFDVDVHLYRSMIGSLMYLTASRPDIMYAVCVCSRFQVTPKTSHLNAVKRIFKYLKGKPNLGLWYPRESPLDLEAFSDSDYGGSNLDRKSTTGGCQFLGQRLISWQCKKQTIVATSTTEAEYVAAANCCGQVLWVQNQLLDYGFNFMNTKIHIDNESTICIVKNPVYHSKTKHIEIRYHFIRDCYEKKLISVEKIHTDLNVADLLTKPFDGPRFHYLVVSIDLIQVLLGVGKDDAGSTWTWKNGMPVVIAIGCQNGGQDHEVLLKKDKECICTPEKSKDSGGSSRSDKFLLLRGDKILNNVASEGFKGSQALLVARINIPTFAAGQVTSALELQFVAYYMRTDISKIDGEQWMLNTQRQIDLDGTTSGLKDWTRAKFLLVTIAAQRIKFLAEQKKCVAIRNKPQYISLSLEISHDHLSETLLQIRSMLKLKSKSFKMIRAIKRMNEQVADKEKELKNELSIRKFKEEKEQESKLGTRRKLKSKRRMLYSVLQEKMMILRSAYI